MLYSNRLYLRAIKPEDTHAVFAYRSDAETNRFQGFVPKTLDEVSAFIARNPSEFNLPETWFQLIMIEKETDEIIGDIGVHFADVENQQCEFGCTIRKESHGKGFATEAMTTLINYLFNTLKKHRIYASVDPKNTASIKLLERLGFRKEAHHTQSLLINDVWVDDVIYAILGSEWK